ncbi:MAG: hypothetical protein EOO03_07170 [Chitinophagaceae bacterium]|nr:MAG: hypothetical protein EOO03_07170 [Chitinophagaceae bacterium]
METTPNLLNEDLQVDSIAHAHLKETAMWAKMLGIVGIIISVIFAVLALFAGTFLENMSGGIGYTAGMGVMISIIYLIIAGINFAISLFIFRFATKMKLALQTVDQENFNSSLYNLKLVYRIAGIIVIIYLAFVILALVVGIGAAAFS